MNDYLWDGKGSPDPEVQRLERVLEPFRHRTHVQRPRQDTVEPGEPARTLPHRALWMFPVAAAAFISALLLLSGELGPQYEGTYRLESLAGSAVVTDANGRTTDPIQLGPGDLISCDVSSRARLRVGPIGSVIVESGTQLRIEENAPHGAEEGYRLYLERGTVAATIFAAPRIFQVGTPAGIAVDMGCVYSATVTDSGKTILSVTSGAVSFETTQRKVWVPASAECVATTRAGPGTPVWQDKDLAFKNAVSALDGWRGGASNTDAQNIVFASKDARDSLTFFHLLNHDDPLVREQAIGRIAAAAELPDEIDLAALMKRDDVALSALFAELQGSWRSAGR